MTSKWTTGCPMLAPFVRWQRHRQRRRAGQELIGAGLVLVAAQAVRVLRELQLRKGAGLDLAHALARDADLGADVLEGHRAGGRKAIAQLEHAALTPRQRLQRLLERGLTELVCDELQR